ncbi:MAG: LysR substrate-binding domain-containing protein, partial [Paracoccaceae bacterium]
LIHSRRDSVFFQSVSQAFQRAQIEFKSSIEVRQFTAACELVSNGLGVSILSELDASKYVNTGLEFRPFRPKIPHRLALLRPTLKRPSMISLEFMQLFHESLRQYQQ